MGDGYGTPGAHLVAALTEAGQTLACAESLTAGLVAATVADTAGASAVLLGGVVAYAAEVKTLLLDVPADLVARVGTVDPAVAVAMAEGVRRRLGATWGLATTGVAGPGPSEGKPAGTVHVAVAGPVGNSDARARVERDQGRDPVGDRRRGAPARGAGDRRHAPNTCAAVGPSGYGRAVGSPRR